MAVRRSTWAAQRSASHGGRLFPGARRPACPSICSRRMSAWPACRASSRATCAMICASVTSALSSGHHATRPWASAPRAVMVASACAKQRRANSRTSSRDSPSAANMSTLSSSDCPAAAQGSCTSAGRSNVSPKYSSSTTAACLTSPSRLVPVGVRGRRASRSLRPSSFCRRAARWRRSPSWRICLWSMGGSCPRSVRPRTPARAQPPAPARPGARRAPRRAPARAAHPGADAASRPALRRARTRSPR